MPSVDHIRPFQPSRPSGPVFIGLNVLRLLSIISLILVFAANVVTLADDIKAIKEDRHSSASTSTTTFHTNNSSSVVEWDCDYYEYSTVPDQTGGEFWSILNRLFIIFQCILLVMSEFGVPKRLFNEYIPVLGNDHGLGSLGVLQALLAASVLSHYCDLFPQVSSWLLFIVGGLNIIAGLVFRASAKSKRLIFSWENASSLTPQTRLAASAWNFVTTEKPFSSSTSQRNPVTSNDSSSTPNLNTSSHATPQMTEVPLDRPGTSHSDTPLLPENTTAPGARFGGFGFGKQADKGAAERGWKISRPIESLPRYAI